MTTKSVTKKSVKNYEYNHIKLRFADREHLQLVRDAAAAAKVSMNAWLVRVTLQAARRELKPR